MCSSDLPPLPPYPVLTPHLLPLPCPDPHLLPLPCPDPRLQLVLLSPPLYPAGRQVPDKQVDELLSSLYGDPRLRSKQLVEAAELLELERENSAASTLGANRSVRGGEGKEGGAAPTFGPERGARWWSGEGGTDARWWSGVHTLPCSPCISNVPCMHSQPQITDAAAATQLQPAPGTATATAT